MRGPLALRKGFRKFAFRPEWQKLISRVVAVTAPPSSQSPQTFSKSATLPNEVAVPIGGIECRHRLKLLGVHVVLTNFGRTTVGVPAGDSWPRSGPAGTLLLAATLIIVPLSKASVIPDQKGYHK